MLQTCRWSSGRFWFPPARGVAGGTVSGTQCRNSASSRRIRISDTLISAAPLTSWMWGGGGVAAQRGPFPSVRIPLHISLPVPWCLTT
ncbi:hypothetical protein FKM82_031142 [Ascaphus truei]